MGDLLSVLHFILSCSYSVKELFTDTLECILITKYTDFGFYPHTLTEHNKQYHMKVLLNSFHFNGLTLGFHPQA